MNQHIRSPLISECPIEGASYVCAVHRPGYEMVWQMYRFFMGLQKADLKECALCFIIERRVCTKKRGNYFGQAAE